MIEKNAQQMKGRWRDTYIYSNGLVEVKEWHSNQIMDASTILMSGIATGQLEGLQYLALGEGNPAWDAVPPIIAKTQTTLTSEVSRIALVLPTGAVYLNPSTGAVSATPTARIEMTVTIPTALVADLREFGLVGGDATTVADTGYLFNHVVHDVISKTALSPLEISRTLDITWLTYDECVAL